MNVITFDLICKFILKQQSDKSFWQNYLVTNWKQSTCPSVRKAWLNDDMVY